MVTIKFRTFEEYKDYITNLGLANPNRAAPYRFHSMSGNNTVNKIVEISPTGNVTLLYDSPTGETIQPEDNWLKANPSLNYPASIIVADVGEAIT